MPRGAAAGRGRSPEALAGPALAVAEIDYQAGDHGGYETDRYSLQREFGCRVDLLGYGGGMEVVSGGRREGVRRERGRERGRQ